MAWSRKAASRDVPSKLSECVLQEHCPHHPTQASGHVSARLWWSRPLLSLILGVRPNSVPRTAGVSLSSVLVWRSVSSHANVS